MAVLTEEACSHCCCHRRWRGEMFCCCSGRETLWKFRGKILNSKAFGAIKGILGKGLKGLTTFDNLVGSVEWLGKAMQGRLQYEKCDEPWKTSFPWAIPPKNRWSFAQWLYNRRKLVSIACWRADVDVSYLCILDDMTDIFIKSGLRAFSGYGSGNSSSTIKAPQNLQHDSS